MVKLSVFIGILIMKKTILVTGASRGIGLELVRQYAEDGSWNVIACCRKPETAIKLHEIKDIHSNLKIMQLNVCDNSNIKELVKQLKDVPIDLLINNAGIYTKKEQQSLGGINSSDMIETFITNTIAPLKVSEALLENVANSKLKTIATITSRLGSIGFNEVGGNYAYRASKAAVNMVMKNLSIDCAHKGIRVILLHPGWVRTDMAGNGADMDVKTSVSGLRNVIECANKECTFYNYDGAVIPW